MFIISSLFAIFFKNFLFSYIFILSAWSFSFCEGYVKNLSQLKSRLEYFSWIFSLKILSRWGLKIWNGINKLIKNLNCYIFLVNSLFYHYEVTLFISINEFITGYFFLKLMWLSKISFISVFIIYSALLDIFNGKCIPIIPTMLQTQNAMVNFYYKMITWITFY